MGDRRPARPLSSMRSRYVTPAELMPLGPIGVVVELFAREALVEIVDESRATSDLMPVPLGALRVRGAQASRRRLARRAPDPSGIEALAASLILVSRRCE